MSNNGIRLIGIIMVFIMITMGVIFSLEACARTDNYTDIYGRPYSSTSPLTKTYRTINIGDRFGNPVFKLNGPKYEVVDINKDEKTIKVQLINKYDRTVGDPMWKKNTETMFTENWRIRRLPVREGERIIIQNIFGKKKQYIGFKGELIEEEELYKKDKKENN